MFSEENLTGGGHVKVTEMMQGWLPGCCYVVAHWLN